MRYLVWYSCGIASAVAAHITLSEQDDVELAYCDTGSEHPDNPRFLSDCEQLFDKRITILKSEKYDDIWDVFDKTKYLVGVNGARCTTELKKIVRRNYQSIDDIQVFGYTYDEIARADRLVKQNPEIDLYAPLIERKMTKRDCFDYFNQFGIKRPMMYDLGFNNNNCIGCVKGGMGYWNHVREKFPLIFEKMVETEAKLGRSVIRVDSGRKDEDGNRIREPLFLKDLPQDRGIHKELYREDLFSHKMSCDFLCG